MFLSKWEWMALLVIDGISYLSCDTAATLRVAQDSVCKYAGVVATSVANVFWLVKTG